MMLSSRPPGRAGRALRALLVGAGSIIAIPTASQAQQAPAAAAPSRASEVHHALEEARVGNIEPAEALLRHGTLTDAERYLLEAQRAAIQLREKEAGDALKRYYAAGDSSPERLSRAYSIAAETAFFSGRYDEAAARAASFLASDADRTERDAEGMARLNRIAQLLADSPPQEIESWGSGAPVPISRDRVGLIRTAIGAGSGEEQAVIDTGANLSVASASAARRLGFRMLDGDAAVGNSLGNGVGVRIAIADRLEIAGAVLRNVPFLVMDDEALTFPVPGGYRIDAIIGLPVLRMLGKLRFGPGNALRIDRSRPDGDGPPNLRVVGSDLYAVVSLSGREHPLFFDTGANATSVSLRFMADHPELAANQGSSSSRAAAGGVERVRRKQVERVALRIGDAEVSAPTVQVEAEPAPGDERRFGVLGADIFRLFSSIVIDFERMRLEVEGGQRPIS